MAKKTIRRRCKKMLGPGLVYTLDFVQTTGPPWKFWHFTLSCQGWSQVFKYRTDSEIWLELIMGKAFKFLKAKADEVTIIPTPAVVELFSDTKL